MKYLVCYCRGNQHVKLKLKIPKTVTARQRELIEEFDNPKDATANATDKESTSGKSSEANKNCNTTFTIDQAWKRVKDYWNSTGTKAAGDHSDTSAKKEAKASV